MAQQASFTALVGPVINLQTGTYTREAQQLMLQWQKQLSGGFDSNGNLKSNLLPSIGISGRSGTVGTILQNIDQNGVVQSAGLVAATATAKGAVQLPAGATGFALGTAALADTGAFDAAGSATAAQNAAKTYADTVAATAQSTAEAYAQNASNLNSGNLNINVMPSQGLTVTITTAALTSTGTQGSITFTNGIVTAQTPAT